MITRAQDYRTITPVGVVNGGILPTRDVAADGSAHGIRAEDLDFMIEAGNERRALFGRSAPVYPHAVSPSMVCDHNDWNALAFDGNGPGGFYYSFFKSETDRNPPRAVCINPAEPFQNIGFTATSLPSQLGTLYPGSVLSASLDLNGFYYPLKLDTLRRFYYDLSRADRLMFPYLEYSWTGTVTKDDFQYDQSGNSHYIETTEQTNSLYHHQVEIAYIAGKLGYPPYDRYMLGVRNFNVSLALPQPSLVASAKLVARFHLKSYDGASRQTSHRYWAESFDMYRTADGFGYNGDFGMRTMDIPNQTGASYPPQYNDPYANMSWAEWNITNAWVVAWYNFRTEIRSLNWQWTP